MNTKHDTITVLLAVAMEAAQALLTLTVALVALLLTLARASGMPSPNPAGRRGKEQDAHTQPVPQPWSQAGIIRRIKRDHPEIAEALERGGPAPLLHPLALVAEQLEALPVTRLRPMAGVTSKRHRKAELVAALVAC